MLDFQGRPDTDWFRKYKSIKRKYKDLYNLRISSVAHDIETVSNRIEEHKRVHQLAIEEVESHTRDIQKEIQLTEKMRASIADMDSNVRNLRRNIKSRDPILGVIIDYPKLKCHLQKPGQYRIRSESGLEFGLVKEDSLRYIPIKVPSKFRGMDTLRKEFVMRLTDLTEFCRRIDSL